MFRSFIPPFGGAVVLFLGLASPPALAQTTPPTPAPVTPTTVPVATVPPATPSHAAAPATPRPPHAVGNRGTCRSGR